MASVCLVGAPNESQLKGPLSIVLPCVCKARLRVADRCNAPSVVCPECERTVTVVSTATGWVLRELHESVVGHGRWVRRNG